MAGGSFQPSCRHGDEAHTPIPLALRRFVFPRRPPVPGPLNFADTVVSTDEEMYCDETRSAGIHRAFVRSCLDLWKRKYDIAWRLWLVRNLLQVAVEMGSVDEMNRFLKPLEGPEPRTFKHGDHLGPDDLGPNATPAMRHAVRLLLQRNPPGSVLDLCVLVDKATPCDCLRDLHLGLRDVHLPTRSAFKIFGMSYSDTEYVSRPSKRHTAALREACGGYEAFFIASEYARTPVPNMVSDSSGLSTRGHFEMRLLIDKDSEQEGIQKTRRRV